MKIVSFISALVLLLTPAPSMAQDCPTFNPSNTFYEEYSGPVWKVPNGHRVITWGLGSSSRPFSVEELNTISKSFDQWDQYLDSISFKKIDALPAEITVSYAPLNWYQGYWTNLGNSKYKIEMNSTGQVSKNIQIFHYIMMQEIGNVLGLGDIHVSKTDVFSVMVDGMMRYDFSGYYEFDRIMIRTIYGESTCSTATPIATPTSSPKVAEIPVLEPQKGIVESVPSPTPTPSMENKPLLKPSKPLPKKTIKKKPVKARALSSAVN